MTMKKLFLALLLFTACKKSEITPVRTSFQMKFSGYGYITPVKVTVNGKEDYISPSHGGTFILRKGDAVHVSYERENDTLTNGLNIVIDDKAVRIFHCKCTAVFDTIIQ